MFSGRKDISRRSCAIASASEPEVKWATPDLLACTIAPPRSSVLTSSWVTVFTTCGPVTNMYEVCSTIITKSVMAGE